jgi:glycerophosphoryl diester phosphodiesterase
MSTANWPYPKLFAHRGGGIHAPENTLAAMRTGAQHGYRAVEFDVKLTKDQVPYLLHDDTFERTTSGHGLAKDSNLNDVLKLDAGSWHSAAFANERVPTFDRIAEYMLNEEMLANVEIKPCAGREAETGELVASACAKLWAGQPVPALLSSFSVEALRAARRVSPDLWLGLLVKQPSDADQALLDELGCISYHFAHAYATQAIIDRTHTFNRRVMLYTVNEVDRARALFAMGVDGLFTDQLERFASAFGENYLR